MPFTQFQATSTSTPAYVALFLPTRVIPSTTLAAVVVRAFIGVGVVVGAVAVIVDNDSN